MADEQVVIVDDEGTRHVFPAGFDPQKAIAIVKQSASGSSQEAAKPAEDSMLRKAAQFGVGVPVGAVKGVVGIPMGIAKMAYGLGSDAVDMYHGKEPAYAKSVLDSVGQLTSLPSRFMAADPETKGEMVGDAAATIGTMRAIPETPAPVARGLGGAIENTGKLAKWPMRISGAHQIIQGNIPTGAAMLMAPELAQKVGGAIRKWGETDPEWAAKALAETATAPESVLLKAQQALSTGQMTPEIEASISRLQSDLADQASKAVRSQDLEPLRKLQNRVDQLQGRIGSTKKAAGKAAQNQARLQAIEDAKDGLEAKTPSIRQTVAATDSTGARQSMSTSFAAPQLTGQDIMERLSSAAKDTGVALKASDMMAMASAVKNGASIDEAVKAIQAMKASPPTSVRLPIQRPQPPVVGTPAVAATSVAPPVTVAPETAEALGGAVAAPAPAAVEAAAPAAVPSTRPAQVKLADKSLHSKSGRGEWSATDGFTVNDMQAAGLDPSVRYTAIPPQRLKILMEARAAREASYRTNAGMDAGANSALMRDE